MIKNARIIKICGHNDLSQRKNVIVKRLRKIKKCSTMRWFSRAKIGCTKLIDF